MTNKQLRSKQIKQVSEVAFNNMFEGTTPEDLDKLTILKGKK